MNRIILLDERTISKIAAGEVIERPASVVKELVENSLDAGATEIRVRVSDSGKGLIEIVDDGHGLSPDDLELAFKQHATSKIFKIDDLESLSTMGFRGEALSSIAAVAEVEVSTKEPDASVGTFVKLKNSKIVEKKEVGRTAGTTIRVHKLFTGIPARLKYLKSDRVEVSHIIEVVTERALAYPEVAFRLHNEDVEVLNFPKSSKMLDRLTDVFGRKMTREIVSFRETEKNISMEGHLAKPDISKSSTKDLHVFVNSRPVASRQVVEAIENGYAGLLMRNRHPVGVLFLKIDPKEIDVNVHPTKREVKFADVNSISRLIVKAVATALGNPDIIPKATPKVKEDVRKPAKKEAKKEMVRPTIEPAQTLLVDDVPCEDISESQMLPRMRIIGQIMSTYVLAQSGTDLVIIDQHAAHERVMLEKLKKTEKKGGKARQKLITPIPLSLNKRESQLIEHYREIIEDMGFIIEPFGKDTYLVRAVPVIGGHLEAEVGLLDLIHELAEFGRSKSIEDKRDEIMHLVACHSAIRAGEKLSQNQMRRLIEEMHGIDQPYTCAHGRPTLIRITEKELGKLFRRS